MSRSRSRSRPRRGSNASEETLVDDLNYVFSHDSPLNTCIRAPQGPNLYYVWSDLARPTMTKIQRYDTGEPVAIIHWSSLGLHKVALGNGEPHKVSKTLENGPIYSDVVTFKDGSGKKYDWKGSQTSNRLTLYARDSPNIPLAQFHRSRRWEAEGRTHRTKAYLRIQAKGQAILDTIIWSFCFLEKARREGSRVERRL
ncbi:hypothetical protein M408DRAFT_69362 [Serendipita vermifera MAFF 305830]|uniref:DUF6593 domain-containing protein n=1 Tax=Serendipita vermifera MAFF 305830 TaxID=933852 RepID=A0A0C2XHT0_SERVB|nr:hypothetical protein M408DRAFT_69362 [Serendipita vermifera MAFF 305830]